MKISITRIKMFCIALTILPIKIHKVNKKTDKLMTSEMKTFFFAIFLLFLITIEVSESNSL